MLYIDIYIYIHKYVIYICIHNKLYIHYHLYGIPLLSSSKFFSPCRRKSMKPWNARMRWSKTTARNAARPASSLGKTRGDVACFCFLSWRLTYVKSCGMVWYPGILSEKNGSLEVDSDTRILKKAEVWERTLVGIAIICSFIQLDSCSYWRVLFKQLKELKQLIWQYVA